MAKAPSRLQIEVRISGAVREVRRGRRRPLVWCVTEGWEAFFVGGVCAQGYGAMYAGLGVYVRTRQKPIRLGALVLT